MKITIMTADEQIITLDIDRDETVCFSSPLFLKIQSLCVFGLIH